MKRQMMFYLITLSLVLTVSTIVRAFTFTIFDVPGAITTEALAINNLGQIAGSFRDFSESPVDRGFLRDSNGTLTTFALPGNIFRQEFGTLAINDPGQIVGSCGTPQTVHGFVAVP